MSDIRNPISGKLTEKSLGDFLALYDPEVHAAIIERLNRRDVSGVVSYENLDLCSSQCGHRTALIYGPGCTYKTLDEAAAGRLGDVPSRFEYPREYYAKPRG